MGYYKQHQIEAWDNDDHDFDFSHLEYTDEEFNEDYEEIKLQIKTEERKQKINSIINENEI